MMRLLCFISFHNWRYWQSGMWPRRMCLRCLRREVGVYDMTYGGTYYEVVKGEADA